MIRPWWLCFKRQYWNIWFDSILPYRLWRWRIDKSLEKKWRNEIKSYDKAYKAVLDASIWD